MGEGPTSLPRRVRRRLPVALFGALLIVMWIVFLRPVGLGGPLGMVWVSGSSMEPALHSGDLVLTMRASDYDVGDVVAFEIPEGGIVIHRVIAEQSDGYRFQGDNRDGVDPWTLPPDSITGREVLLVPHGATVLALLRNPVTLATLTAFFTFLWFLRRDDPAPAPSGETIA